MNNVYKNIRQLRIFRGWRQQHVAARLGMSIPAYSKIESGRTDISLSRLEQLAAAFEVDLVVLFRVVPDERTLPGAPEIAILRERLQKYESEIMLLRKKIIAGHEQLRKLNLNVDR